MQDFLYHFMGVSGACVYSVDLSRAFVCVKEWEEGNRSDQDDKEGSQKERDRSTQ